MRQAATSTRAKTVSVVIPTFRRADALRATLAALSRVQHPLTELEVIVVDDGADTASERVVSGHAGSDVSMRYVSQERRGAATARNHGARIARGEVLLFCDDDIIVEPDHLRRHLTARERYGDPLVNAVLVYGPGAYASFRSTPFGRLRLQFERSYTEAADGKALGDGRFEAPYLSACNLALSRELFWALGGFDESFPYAGAEDQDFSLRARRAGRLLIRDHGIRVVHNDQHVSLEQFCTREERGAQTVVVLARMVPTETDRLLLRENGPVSTSDRPSLVLKKIAKWTLSRRPLLSALHRVSHMLERLPVRDSQLHRVYRLLIGLHIFRGVRTGLAGDT